MIWRSYIFSHTLALAVATTVVACGGNTLLEDNTRAAGGAQGQGGSVAPGQGGSVSAPGQPLSNGGTVGACCLAMPICDAGDQMIAASAACPVGQQCYSRQLCCAQIQCMRSTTIQNAGVGGSCSAYPNCNPGDVQIYGTCPAGYYCYSLTSCNSTITCLYESSGVGGTSSYGSGALCNAYPSCPLGYVQIYGACPIGYACYWSTLCGNSIQCGYPAYDAGTDVGEAEDAGSCDPRTEYYRDYFATSASMCMSVRFTCPTGTYSFGNACGCGCEQSPSCPEYVDCMPGSGPVSSLCSSSSSCPYTVRLD